MFCCVYISGWCGSLNRHSCIWKKNCQYLQDDDQISHVGYQESTCQRWHPSLLPEFHIVSYFDSTFLSWVVYCRYTRPRGCLLSVHLTHMWWRTITETVDEEWVRKKNSDLFYIIFNFNLFLLKIVILCTAMNNINQRQW